MEQGLVFRKQEAHPLQDWMHSILHLHFDNATAQSVDAFGGS